MTKAEKRAKAEQEAQKQAGQSSTGESQQQQGGGEGSNEQSSTSQEEQKGEESDAGVKQQEITENQDPQVKEINSLEPLSVFRDTQEGSNQLPVDNEELKMAADKVLEQKNQSGDYAKLHDADDKNLEVLKEEGIVDQESMRPPELKESALSSSDQSGEEKKNSVTDQPNDPEPKIQEKGSPSPLTGTRPGERYSNSGKLAPGELTTGQKLARTHVSTGNHDVTEIRDAASIFIDKIHSLRERYSSSDVQRWASAAITQVELALGLAEKAATA